jgi:hypothetical protein
MQDIRKQFSLDWLSGGDSSRSEQSKSLGQSALDEAVVLYGQPILRRLAKEQNGQMGLHELARAIKDDIPDFKFSELWEVIEHLARLSMVEIVDASDPAGNYIIGLEKGIRSKS